VLQAVDVVSAAESEHVVLEEISKEITGEKRKSEMKKTIQTQLSKLEVKKQYSTHDVYSRRSRSNLHDEPRADEA